MKKGKQVFGRDRYHSPAHIYTIFLLFKKKRIYTIAGRYFIFYSVVFCPLQLANIDFDPFFWGGALPAASLAGDGFTPRVQPSEDEMALLLEFRLQKIGEGLRVRERQASMK